MSDPIRPIRPSYRCRRAERGQTLIVALAVLFVMLFIGGLFVAQVARNLAAAGRGRDAQTAMQLAEAGIRYCGDQLVYGPDGADWRPTPTPPITSAVDTTGVTDPDEFWLQQGYTRVPFGGGRALVRVTYDPHADDPTSQYIRIESVGRPGDLAGGLDPTVFVQNGPAPRLRVQRVAYAALGLTDYLRYITHIDRNTNQDSLGTPPIGHTVTDIFNDPTLLESVDANGHPTGISPDGKNVIVGGGIRDNWNLNLVGPFFYYASPRGNTSLVSPEGISVAGTISLTPTFDVNKDGVIDDKDRQALVNAGVSGTDLTNLPNPNTTPDGYIWESNDPNYNSDRGYVRDGLAAADTGGYTRSMSRLEPPRIDEYVEGTGVQRYRRLTRDSGLWLNANYNTGYGGWGTGIYIDNFNDLQQETTRADINGGYSLRADWLNPNAHFAQSGWQGPFYNPPGVVVELLGNRIRLTRTDNGVFTNPDGSPSTLQGGKVIEIPLTDFDRTHYQLPNGTPFPLQTLDHDGDQYDPNNPNAARPYTDKYSYGVNVVIYAEGNVRVKGIYGTATDSTQTTERGAASDPNAVRKLSRVHLTIVSGGTAYIDGNVVKGDPDRASTCAILAQDYVCVNTTQFMHPTNQSNVWSADVFGGSEGFHTEIGQSRQSVDMAFSFGENPSNYTSGGNAAPLLLMLRHSALAPGPAYLNLFINPGLPTSATPGPFDTMYAFPNPVGAGLSPYYILGRKPALGTGVFVDDPHSFTPDYEERAFPLTGPNVGSFTPIQTPGLENVFRFALDQTIGDTLIPGGSTDYLLGGAMVAPLDIRIEALLYAQTRSFFVIPGYTFNPNPNDTRQAFIQKGVRQSYSENDTPTDKLAKDVVPFYGEPMDVRITIYGAVAENYTASMSDQAAWMAHWGYIPATYGSSAVDGTNVISAPDEHLMIHDPAGYVPGQDPSKDFRTMQESNPNGDFALTHGLRFLYDPAFALPYENPTGVDLMGDTSAKQTLREGRALRYIDRPAILSTTGSGTVLPEIRQLLPPIPKLPVCPNLLYFGDSDQQ